MLSLIKITEDCALTSAKNQLPASAAKKISERNKLAVSQRQKQLPLIELLKKCFSSAKQSARFIA
jgi:hypothetical protein